MIKRQISFLFEDPGFCIDVFCTIAEPVRYYNRDTESGAWYSSTPDWNENGSLIREDLIFEVIANGVVCALDGNGNFEARNPSCLSTNSGSRWCSPFMHSIRTCRIRKH